MDVNANGSLSLIELKTGIQSLGIAISNSEMQMLWKSIKTSKAIDERSKLDKT